MNRIVLCAAFAVALAAYAASPLFAARGEPVVVEAEGQVTLGEDSTISQAKAAALNSARRSALEKGIGVEIHSSSAVYNFQLINDLVVTATKGVIIREKVLENGCKLRDEQLYCIARIQAEVVPIHDERRGNFAVTKLSVRRIDRQNEAKLPVFQNLDEISVNASANQDSYLNIFSIDQNGSLTKLYPNEFCLAEKIPAGKDIVFPDELQRKLGLRLKVKTPKGAKKAVESVLVIATKERTELLKDKSVENPTITDLMREISDLDPSLWAEMTAGYEVRE
jgi:hypothetical protein